MKEPLAMAAVNLYGVLGTLEQLCAIDEPAKAILADISHPVALCFDIKGGPCCTFRFDKSGCVMTEGDAGCNAKMSFSTPEAFNRLIDEGKPGVPTRHPLRVLAFLLGPFTKLTDRLTELLRPSPEALKDRAFYEESTILTLYTVAGAISALANTDSIAKQSASYTVDGSISLGIKDSVSVTIDVRDHVFQTIKQPCQSPRALMEFASIDLANGLFAGNVSTINELCRGNIRLAGMISMIDNVNRILDRVSLYLA